MRIKKTFLFFTFLIVTICLILYVTMDLTVFPNRKTSVEQEIQSNKWLHFEDKLKQLESNMNKNHNDVGEIKEAIEKILPQKLTNQENEIKPEKDIPTKLVTKMIYEKSCPLQLSYSKTSSIQMLEMYKELLFDNPDGGVWKQGWKIEVNENMWNKQHKLKVFVVPHSHNDPGWIKTFDEYYQSQTKKILNNMVEKLSEDPRWKFIWAEISFFAQWWDEIGQRSKEVVKKLIKSKQFEIVTGGWVMNDEANSHWLSVIHQLTEGHQWLKQHLNYTPVSSWSIDPFGMSSTQPVLLKNVGLKNLLIQRVHYSVKKKLASEKNLEFRWRQPWDDEGKTDLLTQLMPFYSYDIPHTCGPDPKVCCQFDFKRLPNHGLSCPWRIPPQVINEKNVAAKALLLLDQYRKKSTLYRSNVLLVPLGDDFRYDHSIEWNLQFQNYQRLFDFMNSKPNLYVQAQFGTLTDYFNALRAERKVSQFPSLTGDFFTYADRDDHYWSGYYTSRPFFKRMDRDLLNYVRAAETILSLAHISGKPGSRWIADKESEMHKSISVARKELSLFQHHDGITGTAKDYVVNDYAKRMLKAILHCQNILQTCTNLLLQGPGADVQGTETIFYNIDDIRQDYNGLPEQFTITIGPPITSKKVVLFNSLTFERNEIVKFIVSTPYIKVEDSNGDIVACQISPIFEHISSMSQSKYQVAFIAKVPPLSLVSYVIHAVDLQETNDKTYLSSIKIFNLYMDVKAPDGFKDIQVSETASEFSLQNSRIIASFNKFGLLKAIKLDDIVYPIHLDFAEYGARNTQERSGAYLFLPDNDGIPIKVENSVVKIIEGPIFSRVQVQLPYVLHSITLYNSTGADSLGLEIENIVDIVSTSNFEIAMRFSTNIDNKDEFFTDLNGYQVLRRLRFKKLPVQANYYPVSSMAYIEDEKTRFTLLTSSPVGGSSLRPSQLEVMMDRRLMQDDNLGVGQGVMDNQPVKHTFRILLENKSPKCQVTSDNHPSGFSSLRAQVSLESLLNPLTKLLRTDDDDITSQKSFTSMSKGFGVDFSLSSFKTGVLIDNKEYVGLVLHRKYIDTCYASEALFKQFPLSPGTVNLSRILPSNVKDSKLNKASLSFLHVGDSISVQENINLCPMDTQAYVLHR